MTIGFRVVIIVFGGLYLLFEFLWRGHQFLIDSFAVSDVYNMNFASFAIPVPRQHIALRMLRQGGLATAAKGPSFMNFVNRHIPHPHVVPVQWRLFQRLLCTTRWPDTHCRGTRGMRAYFPLIVNTWLIVLNRN